MLILKELIIVEIIFYICINILFYRAIREGHYLFVNYIFSLKFKVPNELLDPIFILLNSKNNNNKTPIDLVKKKQLINLINEKMIFYKWNNSV